MAGRSLGDWLAYQQTVHAVSVDLGLNRVRMAWQRLAAPRPAPIVITVGGTNGKGSTAAFLDAMLTAAGRRVGVYTSPHLERYNERVRVAGVEISDTALIDAFERIEGVRGEIPLTYFEFGTLTALWIFSQSELDVAVLEVGLGGRLDAVNVIDADAAIITTIDLDHQDWLGNDRDAIGREKAGIFRAGRPAIIGEADPPAGLLDAAAASGARLIRAGLDFVVETAPGSWCWRCGGVSLDLPPPALAAPVQRANAAAAIAALHALRGRLGWSPAAIASGVRGADISARLQRFDVAGVELVVDVAHNPQAARVLATWLAQQSPRRSRDLAVFSLLGDKDLAGIAAPLAPAFAAWHVAGLDTETQRGRSAAALAAALGALVSVPVATHVNLNAALDAAYSAARPGDRVIAFGSFYVAAAALAWVRSREMCAVSSAVGSVQV